MFTSTLEFGAVKFLGKFLAKTEVLSAVVDHTIEITKYTRNIANCKMEDTQSNALIHGEMDGMVVS